MKCEAIDELLGAYVLGALPADESQQARAHLASCRKHDAALADLHLVVERLRSVAGERAPPAALRARLLHAFDEQVASRRRPASSSRAMVVWWRRPALAWATAAALLLAAIGLVAWNVALQIGGGEPSHTVRAALQGSQGTGELVYLADDRIAVITVDLPALPATRAYQAWRISTSGPVSLGLVSRGVTALSADLSKATTFAITEEPAGGSSQPTSQPLLSTQLPDSS